jgi:hypothetical protein
MSSFPVISDVGLTGGDPRYSLADLREKFALNQPSKRTILLTFGGLGVEAIPYQVAEKYPDWQFITFDRQAPQLDNLVIIKDHKYRPVDFMPLCGLVVSKPGYSTFAEAMRLEIPIASLQRSGFAETPLLLEGIRDYAQHQILNNQDFFQGNWQFLEEQPSSPRQATKLAKDGAEHIAKAILNKLE